MEFYYYCKPSQSLVRLVTPHRLTRMKVVAWYGGLKSNLVLGLVDGPAASIMNPLLTALTAFYATTTTYADGDHHDPPTPVI